MAALTQQGAASRVLVLTKRQYMSKDLIDDRYGRFRELPLEMVRQGSRVAGMCLSYRRREGHGMTDGTAPVSVEWASRPLRSLLPVGPSYWRKIDAVAEQLKPDVVWACSDIAHAAIGVLAARRLNCRLVIDLYDNFESYPVARIPGVISVLRWAVQRADGVTCVSAPLADYVRQAYDYRGPIQVIENAIPEGMFVPGNKHSSRRALDLPEDAVIIGTAGALSRGRGLQHLLEAFELLAQQREDVFLVLAGPLDGSLVIPAHTRIRYLGLLPSSKVPDLLSALDLSVICNRDSSFGRYCFPQKLYESLACNTPVAVARVGAMADLLREYPSVCFDPDSTQSLLETMNELLMSRLVPSLPIPTWSSLAQRLAMYFSHLPAPNASNPL